MANKVPSVIKALLVVAALVIFGGSGAAFGHAEDEICDPATGADPVLCNLLNKALNGTLTEFDIPPESLLETRSAFENAVFFGEVGINHILPGGLDHILFVLALFLASTRLKSLIIQITTFTIAHTATLGLTAAGILEPPASIVEPLIALSIAFVAIENIVFQGIPKWRTLIIFGFGLFHGMGFAGFLQEVGLPDDQFWPGLIGFNIGVELGQLSVVAAALLLSLPLKAALEKTNITYRAGIVIPASLVIGLTGLWWAITRSLGLS